MAFFFMKWLSDFLSKLLKKKPETIIIPERTRFDNNLIEEILNRELVFDARCFKLGDTKNYGIYLADKDYYAVDTVTCREWCHQISSKIMGEVGGWSAEVFDCDNWATRFKSEFDVKFLKTFPQQKTGAFCGIAWYWFKENNVIKYGHAVNIIFDTETQKLRLVEPQTGDFIDNIQNVWFYYVGI